MIVRMVYEMSGGRYDDRAWPPTWTDFEVPDEEGRGLVACGAAVFIASSAAPAAKPVVQAPAVKAPSPEPEPVKAEAVVPEPAETPRPSPADPKAAWVAYAVSRGAPRSEAEDSTKAQLQAAYGGRL